MMATKIKELFVPSQEKNYSVLLQSFYCRRIGECMNGWIRIFIRLSCDNNIIFLIIILLSILRGVGRLPRYPCYCQSEPQPWATTHRDILHAASLLSYPRSKDVNKHIGNFHNIIFGQSFLLLESNFTLLLFCKHSLSTCYWFGRQVSQPNLTFKCP